MTEKIRLGGELYALVDAEDLAKVTSRVWYAHREGNNWYAVSSKPTPVKMHQLILPDVAIVDHVNRNGLDNRRVNLRRSSPVLNQANSRRRKDNKSGHRGVSWDKAREKWKASIKDSGVRKTLGRFTTREEAIAVYNAEALRLWGDHYAEG